MVVRYGYYRCKFKTIFFFKNFTVYVYACVLLTRERVLLIKTAISYAVQNEYYLYKSKLLPILRNIKRARVNTGNNL